MQVKVPDPEPAAWPRAGMYRCVRHLAAVVDEDGSKTLHNVSRGCKRYDGDRINKMRSEKTNRKEGSRAWKKAVHNIRKELRKISHLQHH